MAEFFLKIIASDHKFFAGLCKSLVVPMEDGEKGILAKHEDMIIALVPGELRFTTAEGETRRAAIGRGLVQIANNRVSILTDYAERPEDIDELRAREALERAEEKLRQKKSIREYYEAQAAIARALSRLKETQKKFD